MIVTPNLNEKEKKLTLDTLTRYKRAFAYEIANIPRVNPNFCSQTCSIIFWMTFLDILFSLHNRRIYGSLYE